MPVQEAEPEIIPDIAMFREIPVGDDIVDTADEHMAGKEQQQP